MLTTYDKAQDDTKNPPDAKELFFRLYMDGLKKADPVETDKALMLILDFLKANNIPPIVGNAAMFKILLLTLENEIKKLNERIKNGLVTTEDKK